MDPLNEAIALNNEGASLIDCGRSLDAIHQIRKAVDFMNDFRGECDSSPFKTPNSSQDDHSTLYIKKSLQQQQHNSFFVYCRPVRIPTNVDLSSIHDDFATHFQTTNCYIFFNLAIACHQFGMASGFDAPLLLAKEFYQGVLLIQSQLHANVSDSQSHYLIQCLVMNNLAHIHSERCEYDSSQCCINCVCDLIARTGCLNLEHFLPETATARSVWLRDDEVNEIKLNLMFGEPPTMAQAA